MTVHRSAAKSVVPEPKQSRPAASIKLLDPQSLERPNGVGAERVEVAALTSGGCASARLLLGWTDSVLAREAGVAPKTVRRLEQGGPTLLRTRRTLTATLRRHGVAISEDGETALFRRFGGDPTPKI